MGGKLEDVIQRRWVGTKNQMERAGAEQQEVNGKQEAGRGHWRQASKGWVGAKGQKGRKWEASERWEGPVGGR